MIHILFLKICRLLAVLALVFFVCGARDAVAQYTPDYYQVTATANYRPVDRPGMQRRVAQTDAEEKARRQIYEYVGSMQTLTGRTVNDYLATDARLKARVLEIIRTSETYDWGVSPACACVQVWVRLDLNQIRAALRQCGY